jgi:hypothetical protein
MCTSIVDLHTRQRWVATFTIRPLCCRREPSPRPQISVVRENGPQNRVSTMLRGDTVQPINGRYADYVIPVVVEYQYGFQWPCDAGCSSPQFALSLSLSLSLVHPLRVFCSRTSNPIRSLQLNTLDVNLHSGLHISTLKFLDKGCKYRIRSGEIFGSRKTRVEYSDVIFVYVESFPSACI